MSLHVNIITYNVVQKLYPFSFSRSLYKRLLISTIFGIQYVELMQQNSC